MIVSNLLRFLGMWLKGRLHVLALKAPREVPVLLIVVCILAVILVLLYTYILASPNV